MESPVRSTGDLAAVVAWTIGAAAAVLRFGVGPSLLRTVLVVPLVVLFPGYALLAALFPERPLPAAVAAEKEGSATVGGVDRLVLSVAASLAVVPLVAFGMNFTRYGVRLRPLLYAIAGLTVALSVLGYVARISLPVDRRFRVTVPGGLARYFTVGGLGGLRERAPLEPGTETERMLNLFFAFALVVLAATVGYAAVAPGGDEQPYTEFYLLSQDDEGRYITDDLPHEFTPGESRTLWVAIANHEGQRVPYTVVVQLDGTEVDRFSTRVAPGRTVRVQRDLTVDRTGQRQRLSFLLYRGDVPAEPTPENAYRETHLWVNVGGGG